MIMMEVQAVTGRQFFSYRYLVFIEMMGTVMGIGVATQLFTTHTQIFFLPLLSFATPTLNHYFTTPLFSALTQFFYFATLLFCHSNSKIFLPLFCHSRKSAGPFAKYDDVSLIDKTENGGTLLRVFYALILHGVEKSRVVIKRQKSGKTE